ncbi:YafY family protein [Streptomyces sp. BRB081]|uniref:helix-turn-helix transcriptional regulator n=1 Tax=Streptomyces sp. BRB081 TaxID=2769544 RepID=UPI0018ACDAF5|nr:WYL domain-containing protein [Streptomyces sp. BRB081]MBL3807117.1 WYL domain-containing protein [Streptomyces sp. BRB081]
MRAARLIRMVLLLQSRPRMTAAELAGELEVSERTVARDAQALSEAGVPVYAERGRAGGYALVGGYRTGLTGLAPEEAQALFLSGVPGALREMGLGEAASAARLKVSAALAPPVREASRAVNGRFHLDAPAWYTRPEAPGLLAPLAEAVWDDRRVAAAYRRADREVRRELEPYGLVLKAGVWYVCARAEGAGRARVYRVDRFTEVRDLGTRFARDTGFDLARFWRERAEEFARPLLREEVRLRLSPAGARRLPGATDPRAAREALAAAGWRDGSARWVEDVVLPVESLEVAYEQLLGLGPEAEVVAPPELRDRMREAARRMAGLYG